jgi:hypothetical protein
MGDNEWLAAAKKNPPADGVAWATKMVNGEYI